MHIRYHGAGPPMVPIDSRPHCTENRNKCLRKMLLDAKQKHTELLCQLITKIEHIISRELGNLDLPYDSLTVKGNAQKRLTDIVSTC